MLILAALWHEPFALSRRCRLFIMENCSTAKYPDLISPLECVLLRFYFSPLLRVLLKCLTGNTSEAKEDAISSQRITRVSAARMRTARASRATEGLRSRDLNKRQQRQPRRSHMDEQDEQVQLMKQWSRHVSRLNGRH